MISKVYFKARSEAIRAKKKLEGEMADIEIQLAHSNRQKAQFQQQVKELSSSIKEIEIHIDEEERLGEGVRENYAISNRRAEILCAEIEESRANLEQIERARKVAETELVESRDRANLLHQQNNVFINQKRKYERELQVISDEVEEALNEAKNAKDKAVKAVQDRVRNHRFLFLCNVILIFVL